MCNGLGLFVIGLSEFHKKKILGSLCEGVAELTCSEQVSPTLKLFEASKN